MKLGRQLAGMMLVLTVLMSVAYTVVAYRKVREAALVEVDQKLMLAAGLAREILPADFHDRIIDETSVPTDEYAAMVARYDRLCLEHDLEYLWSVMDVGGAIRFTSGTSVHKETHEEHASFFEEHSNPEAYAEMLASQSIQYSLIADKWGSVRTVLVPGVDDQGRPFAFGAAMKLSDVEAMLSGLLRQSIMVGAVLCFMGILLSLVIGQVIAQPIADLTEKIRTAGPQHLPDPVPVKGSFEHRALAETFNSLAQTIQSTLDELRASEQEYRELADLLPQTVCEVDAGGRITYANRRAREVFGYDADDLAAGLMIASVIAPEDRQRAVANVMAIIQGGGDSRQGTEYQAVRKDGEVFPALIYSAPITKNNQPAGMRSVMIDLSDQKRLAAERQLIETQYHQAQKVESIGRLAGGVAHDLNNLLTPILGFGEILQQDLDPDDPRRECVEEIRKAGLRARDLVGQLLAFSRKQTLEYAPVDMTRVVTDFEGLLRRTIREDIEIDIVAPATPCTFMADLGQIEQVVLNLAINGQDAMPEGGRLTLETDLVEFDEDYVASHPGSEVGRFVMLAVLDTGGGMDADTQKHLF